MKGFRAGTILAFLLVLCSVAGRTSAQSTGGGTIPDPAGSSTAAPAPIFQAQGSEDQTTGSFAVPASWRVIYTYDCAAFSESQGGDFSIYIRMPDGSYSGTNSPIHAHPYGDTGSGTQDYHTGGPFYFDVVSDCSWSITVPAP